MATQIIMDLNGDTRHTFDERDVKAQIGRASCRERVYHPV